jgi:23S rRNA (guanine745-N1)-methyltransferase
LAVPVHDRLPPAVVAALRCPHEAGPLTLDGRTLRCVAGHAFDVARQGHVDLRGPRGSHGPGDDAAMVARRLAVLGAGHFDPLLEVLVRTVRAGLAGPAGGVRGLVVDVGAGPGVHLARVLDALPAHHGLAIDVSKHAARRAALAHPRAGSVVADVWRGLPVADGAAAAVLDVFAPRDADEFARLLGPGGVAVVVTPHADHLAALARPLGLLTVDPAKETRLAVAFGRRFTTAASEPLRWPLRLDRAAAVDLAGMGPGGHHVDAAELARRAAALPERLEVEAAVTVTTYRPRSDGPPGADRDRDGTAEEARR